MGERKLKTWEEEYVTEQTQKDNSLSYYERTSDGGKRKEREREREQLLH